MINANEYGLLIVDIQGKLARIVHDSDAFILQTQKLIRCCQLLSIPIVTLEQNPQGLGPTVPELASLLADTAAIEKHHFNGIEESKVQLKLSESGIKNWLVAGIEAHICVYQTVIGLQENHYCPIVVTDCISSRTQSNRDLAISKMQGLGVEVTSLEMCIYQFLGSSQHKAFKKVLSIIK